MSLEVEVRIKDYSLTNTGITNHRFVTLRRELEQRKYQIVSEDVTIELSKKISRIRPLSLRRIEKDGQYIFMTKEVLETIEIPKYGYNIVYSREQEIASQEIVDENDLISQKWFYRRKKRTSYLFDEHVRLDLTEVYSRPTFDTEKLIPSYEVELELINFTDDEKLEPSMVDFLKQNIIKLFMMIYQSNYIFSKTEYQNLVYFFNSTLGDGDFDKNRFDHRVLFQARNLQIEDLVGGNVDKPGGLFNSPDNEIYTISYKADGSRKLLVIDITGLWLISPPNTVSLIYRSSLLDDEKLKFLNQYRGLITEGELIDYENRTSVTVRPERFYYLIYDVLSRPRTSIIDQSTKSDLVNANSGDSGVQALSLIKRLESVEEFIIKFRSLFNQTGLETILITSKPFYFFTDLTTLNGLVDKLERRKPFLNYQTDGYVFTPNNMHYNSGISRDIDLSERKLTRYPDICKWKPQSLQTVDLIKRKISDNDYQFFSFSGMTNKLIRLAEFNGSTNRPLRLVPELFQQYDSYPDDQVIEFVIDPNRQTLIPYLLRSDKPKPNSYKVALNNWMTALKPIYLETLVGQNFQLMRRYHNRIKAQMLSNSSRKKSGSVSLLDIGSGQGGDLSKWRDYKKVIIVEPSLDKIFELTRRMRNLLVAGRDENVIQILVNRDNLVNESDNDDDETRINSLNSLNIGEINRGVLNDISEIDHQIKFLILVTGAESSDFIYNAVNIFLQNKKVDVVSMFLSLTFFWRDREYVQLAETISKVAGPKSLILFFTLDGRSLDQFFNPVLGDGLSIRETAYTIDKNIEVSLTETDKRVILTVTDLETLRQNNLGFVDLYDILGGDNSEYYQDRQMVTYIVDQPDDYDSEYGIEIGPLETEKTYIKIRDNRVLINIGDPDSYVKDVQEYKVYLPDLWKKIEEKGLVVKNLTEYRADQESGLNIFERNISQLYTYGSFILG